MPNKGQGCLGMASELKSAHEEEARCPLWGSVPLTVPYPLLNGRCRNRFSLLPNRRGLCHFVDRAPARSMGIEIGLPVLGGRHAGFAF